MSAEATRLATFARAAREMLARETDLAQFEVYCSNAEQIVVRLNYTSEIPSRGVEEAKSHIARGLSVRIVTRRDPHETGFGSEAGELSLEAMRSALAKARASMVADPHFSGLPVPLKARRADKPRDGLRRIKDRALVDAGWAILAGALNNAPMPGLVVGGDVSLMRDQVAIAGSNFEDIRSDFSAHFRSSVTVFVESLNAKGTATALGATADEFRGVAGLGRDAARTALALQAAERAPSGAYKVVLGPQPIAEILNYMVMGSLTTGAFFAASSAYQERFGQRVMDRRLNLTDDPNFRRGAIRRRITCEGFGTSRTEVIRAGRLVGLMSDHYDTHRLCTDSERDSKLGTKRTAEFPPHSGYRLGESPTRRFDAHPGAAGTNVVMRATEGVSEAELIRRVCDGIYVGRVWYTYPINGQRAGDFTCTISGDSWLIRGGRFVAPLTPNCLRINGNIAQVFGKLLGAENRVRPAMIWGSPEAYYVPALAVPELTLAEIDSEP